MHVAHASGFVLAFFRARAVYPCRDSIFEICEVTAHVSGSPSAADLGSVHSTTTVLYILRMAMMRQPGSSHIDVGLGAARVTLICGLCHCLEHYRGRELKHQSLNVWRLFPHLPNSMFFMFKNKCTCVTSCRLQQVHGAIYSRSHLHTAHICYNP